MGERSRECSIEREVHTGLGRPTIALVITKDLFLVDTVRLAVSEQMMVMKLRLKMKAYRPDGRDDTRTQLKFLMVRIFATLMHKSALLIQKSYFYIKKSSD